MSKNSNVLSIADYINNISKVTGIKGGKIQLSQLLTGRKCDNMNVEVSISINEDGNADISYDNIDVAQIDTTNGKIQFYLLNEDEVEYLESNGVEIREVNGDRFL